MTTALLGLFTLLGISAAKRNEAKQSNRQQTINEDDGYTFIATLFSSTDDPNISLAHYYLKDPDSTLYLDIYSKGNDLSRDSLLDGKIFVYDWNVVSYAFFCKRPEAGKPIEYASEMNGRPSRVVPISRSTARGSSSSNMRTCREERKSGRRSPRPPKSTPSTGFTGGRVARYLSILMSSSTNTVYSQEIILPLHCSYIY